MTKQSLIKDIVKIILKHCQPERIYLYGSQATGEASPTSDIDIAYEAANFKKNYLIEEDIQKLNTLLKIDLKNLSYTEDRFKNRVISTGRVLYSSNKKLRAQDGLHNFQNAYEKFQKIVSQKQEFEQQGFGDVYLDIVIKRFEFTYEMSWKALKRYLDFVGIQAQNPRTSFQEAYAQGILKTQDIWLDMIEMRNLTSHIYDENEVKEILDRVKDYDQAFAQLLETLKTKVEKA
jgi:nucleotidyltransferase substrate binding protein (TIGR01987 family)